MLKQKLFTMLALFICISNVGISQTKDEVSDTPNFSLSADLVTNYIWRGLVYSDKPNIQPYMAYTNNKGNFSIGSWGSYSLADYYSEVDFFASYTYKNFTLSVWDYFIMSQQVKNKYFNYDDTTTNHAFEGMLSFIGPEAFPVELIASTFLYGNDRKPNGDNYYSSYFEIAYPFKWKSNNLKAFMGLTPAESFYASDIAVTNIGVKSSRSIKVNEKFAIPVSGSVIINPNLENIYFVFAMTLSAND